MTQVGLKELLSDYRSGDQKALDRIIPLIYDDLKQVARRSLRRWGSSTLDTTGLVHETYLKFQSSSRIAAEDRGHFLAICATAMRQLLLNHTRAKHAQKRGAGAAFTDLDGQESATALHIDTLRLPSEWP